MYSLQVHIRCIRKNGEMFVLIFHYYLLCLSPHIQTHTQWWQYYHIMQEDVVVVDQFIRVFFNEKKKIEIDNKLGAHEYNDEHTCMTFFFFFLIYIYYSGTSHLSLIFHSKWFSNETMVRASTTSEKKATNTYTLFNLLNSFKWMDEWKDASIRQTGTGWKLCRHIYKRDWSHDYFHISFW